MITGSSRPMINVAMMLDGKNFANGQDVRIRVFQAQLRSDTEFDFLGEEFPALSFTGIMLTPEGKSWPFEVQ